MDTLSIIILAAIAVIAIVAVIVVSVKAKSLKKLPWEEISKIVDDALAEVKQLIAAGKKGPEEVEAFVVETVFDAVQSLDVLSPVQKAFLSKEFIASLVKPVLKEAVALVDKEIAKEVAPDTAETPAGAVVDSTAK